MKDCGARKQKTTRGTRQSLTAPYLVGLGRFELPTSPLSGVRSNQLSYRPMVGAVMPHK